MDEYKILKQEEKLCDDMWEQSYQEAYLRGEKYATLEHMHVCDFELLNFKYYKTRKELNKEVKKECKKYLSSIGKERDKYLECCDYCIHNRYITISEDTPGLILNIATLCLDDRWKNNVSIEKAEKVEKAGE